MKRMDGGQHESKIYCDMQFFCGVFCIVVIVLRKFLSMQKSRNRKKWRSKMQLRQSTKQEQRVTSETKLVIEKWEEESEELVKRRKRHATGVCRSYKGKNWEKQLTVEIKDKSWEGKRRSCKNYTGVIFRG